MTTKETWLAAARAWRKLAERIDDGRWLGCGLCVEINEWGNVAAAMRGQLRLHVDAHARQVVIVRREVGASLYWVDYNNLWMSTEYLDQPDLAESRVLFCLLLALEAEDEAAAL